MDSDFPQSSSQPSMIGDVGEYSKQLLSSIVSAVKASSNLPHSGDDFDLYNSFPGFRSFYIEQGSRITSCINSFLHHQGTKALPVQQKTGVIDTEDRYDRIVETNDMMLEQISTLLDAAASSKKTDVPLTAETVIKNAQTTLVETQPVVSSWNRLSKQGKKRTFKLFHAQNISRPQNKFKDKIDNSNVPFVPKITRKPNAIKPLPKALVDLNSTAEDSDISLAIANLVRRGREYDMDDQDIYSHPYEAELHSLKFLESQLERVEPQKYEPFPPMPCEVITAVVDLQSCIDHLKTCPEFAVDLEAHTYRSFQGITCLMQISSRTTDFLIDTLQLRSEIWRFNEVFTDPKIVKVFHGADFDILWLQRDFGVYVVNLFDTGRAAREMNLGHYSLDFLLQRYCDVHADKKYQLADWRIRPIPEEMRKYAQEDTHYLLYVYDVMKNELLDMGMADNLPGSDTSRLLNVLNKSRDICLKKYEKFLLTATSHLQLYEKRRFKKQLNDKQLELLRLLFIWRDTMARQEDESTGYILPKHMLFQIAEIMPREAQGVLACCNPVPPLVHQHVHVIHQLILEARAKSFAKKSDTKILPESTKTPVPANPEVHDYDDMLSCPHDLSHIESVSVPLKKPSEVQVTATTWSSFLGDAKRPSARHTDNLSRVKKSNWNPFEKYFASSKDSHTSKPTKAITSLENISLKTMLDPEYSWVLRNLQAEIEEKLPATKEIKQPDVKEEIIILNKLPQMQGQKRQSQPQTEKKLSKHAKKKAKKLSDAEFTPFSYQKEQYKQFTK